MDPIGMIFRQPGFSLNNYGASWLNIKMPGFGDVVCDFAIIYSDLCDDNLEPV